jgi:hypothetical protein
MNEYLTRADLHELTGRQQRPAQIAWLRKHRWRFTVTADDEPRVLRAYRDKRLLDEAQAVAEAPEPNFAALG